MISHLSGQRGHFLQACLWLLLFSFSGMASAAPRVVVSIAPLHSLVAGVMEGVAEPQLLIAANASPHAYSLRPSEARMLSQAELVIWVGEDLETMLVQPLRSLAGRAEVLTLSQAEDIWLLPLRQGGAWEVHDHAKDDHHHGHKHHHSHRDGHRHGHHHEHHHDKGHGHPHHAEAATDPHIWLAPRNAERIVTLVAEQLARLDPANAPRYQDNAEQMSQQIAAVTVQLQQQLTPLRGMPYIVFHDAYRYFEESFGLTPVGSITISPEQAPGARRLAEIRQTIQQREARCVFSEPQFRPAVVKVVLEGTQARTGELDPLGATISPGISHWFGLMKGLAENLSNCLTME